FIQIIDFLSVKRRPEKEKYFDRFLRIRTAHRERLATATNNDGWLDASEGDVRSVLKTLADEVLDDGLNERELEALRFGYRERGTDTHLPHSKKLPQEVPSICAAAAERARVAGFDGVELHYAHAYTMAGFLSAQNDRGDGYGGVRGKRLHLSVGGYCGWGET